MTKDMADAVASSNTSKDQIESIIEQMKSLSAPEKKLVFAEAEKKACKHLVSTKNAAEWQDNLDDIQEYDLWSYFYEDTAGDAKLYNRLNRRRVAYVGSWAKFLVWTGSHWIEDEYNIAYQRSESVVAAYQKLIAGMQKKSGDGEPGEEEAKSERKKNDEKVELLKRRIRTLRSRPGKDNLLAETCRVFDHIQIAPSDIDRHPYLLPCKNGVIDLKNGDLRQGDPDTYLLNAAATPYYPALFKASDPCPEMNAFLLSSMGGDTELVNYIWDILGYGLIRERRDHIFPIFWGAHGRNGKDTLIKIVSKVLGQQLSGTVPVELILQSNQPRNSAAPSPDVMALRGMCIAWINEAEDGQRFAMSKIKQLTGGGNITARGLQDKKMTTFMQSHLPILTTNELPKSRADDSAFWARVQILKWELSFVDDPKQDYERPAVKDLDDILEAEAPGVLARMVQSAVKYAWLGKIEIPQKVKDWTQNERDIMDDLGAFLAECCIIEDKHDTLDEYMTQIKAKDLNKAWAIWYAENRDAKRIPSSKALAIMLEKREIYRKKVGGVMYRLGLELNGEWQERIEEAGRFNDHPESSWNKYDNKGNDYGEF